MTRPHKTAVTRARAKREQYEARAQEIARMMCNGSWVVGSSHVALATKWRLPAWKVQALATEASKLVRLVVSLDPAELRTRAMAGLEAIRAGAMKKTRTWVTKDGDEFVSPDPDFKSAIAAYELQLRMLGAIGRPEATVSAEPLVAMSPEERARFYREAAEEEEQRMKTRPE